MPLSKLLLLMFREMNKTLRMSLEARFKLIPPSGLDAFENDTDLTVVDTVYGITTGLKPFHIPPIRQRSFARWKNVADSVDALPFPIAPALRVAGHR